MKNVKLILITLLMSLMSIVSFGQEVDNPLEDYSEYTTQDTYLKRWSMGTKILTQTKILELDTNLFIFTFKDLSYTQINVYKSFVIYDIDEFVNVLSLYLNKSFDAGITKNFTFENYSCKAYRNMMGKTTVQVKHKLYNFYFTFALKDLKHINKGLTNRI